ncbi:hypothetical protein ILYODFUR_038693 [Ilyodon furcidens]|uniref:Uncharacterized protein n=1 Tax=Ilyodon furcidens TaxID=33524 RepID=A0ABV0T570_9TELE
MGPQSITAGGTLFNGTGILGARRKLSLKQTRWRRHEDGLPVEMLSSDCDNRRQVINDQKAVHSPCRCDSGSGLKPYGATGAPQQGSKPHLQTGLVGRAACH